MRLGDGKNSRRATDGACGPLICPSGKISRSLSSPLAKKISLRRLVEAALVIPTVPPLRGALAIVTNVGRDAVDAFDATDERIRNGRRSRVVLAPRRWREVLKKLTLLRDDGDKEPDRRREHGASRKTIAQGRPECCSANLW